MIEFVAETGSTNSDLAARLRGGSFVPEGDWLVASRQTAGRGRQGRAWLDGQGNFMGSTIVHPRFGDAAAGSLALVAGLAVQEVMSKYLSAPHLALLKWPNDVMVGRAKLAGILMEREGEAVIIGIGVNLVSAPQLPDRDTVALAKFEQAPECDTFARELARVFDLELERWRNFGLAPIINRWLAAAHPLGTPLSIGEPGETPQTGTFAGLSPDGALQVRLADGTTQTLHAGEVRLAAP